MGLSVLCKAIQLNHQNRTKVEKSLPGQDDEYMSIRSMSKTDKMHGACDYMCLE